ncbi:Metallo-dependent phosphatase-like protein [Hysterangium stoloniferum]|nr:Metallo-dependent phosphatase-like protein [Hysterangium stoloniferum]
MSTRRQRTTAPAATTPLLNKHGAVPRALRRRTGASCLPVLGVIILLSLLLIFIVRISSPLVSPIATPGVVDGQYTLRVVAVGDLHSDYDNALKVLQMADVVDNEGNWSGNVDYFVQTGDIIDRGLDTIKLFQWMERLRVQARAAGGQVFSHLGNHEYMNALGDWRYVLQDEIATFGSIQKRQAAIANGFLGSAWTQNYTAVSRVPLHPAAGSPFVDYNASALSSSPLSHASLSFMHGGLSPSFALSHGTPYPSKINAIGASLLKRCRTRDPQPMPYPPGEYAGLPPGSTSEEIEFYGSDGPLWYRGWAQDDEDVVCAKVGAVTTKIGVRRLIMGHTPDFDKIVSRCGGKIIIIDTGISKAYGGVLSALSINYTLTPESRSTATVAVDNTANATVSNIVTMDSNSTSTQQSIGKGVGTWKEREHIIAIYPNRREELVLEEREIVGDFW